MSINSISKSKCHCDTNNLDYYHQIEKYKSKLKESHNNNNRLELEISDTKDRHRKEISKLNDEITRQKDKYDRLHESHKRISRLNHELEERILNLIDKFNQEKSEIDKNHNDLCSKYESSQQYILELQNDCDRYRHDCTIAVQLLQNNPSSFLSRHVETIPIDLKHRVIQLQKDIDIRHSFDYKNNQSNSIQFKNQNSSNSYIPITTFPPTAMIFSDNLSEKSNGPYQNHVCASLLAEVLHPDKVTSQQRSQQNNKITIEVVCNKCGTVKEYSSVCVQTTPNSSENNSNQKNLKNNKNLIFDV